MANVDLKLLLIENFPLIFFLQRFSVRLSDNYKHFSNVFLNYFTDFDQHGEYNT